MDPSLQQAAEILRAGGQADAALRRFMQAHPGLPADRRQAVRDAVFAACRWRGWSTPGVPLTRQIGEALRLDASFCQDPRSIKPEALRARAVPAWVWTELDVDAAAAGAWLRRLQAPPALWLRPRRADIETVAASLGSCSPATSIHPALAALRYEGREDLFHTAVFREGRFEIQDVASQLAGLACAPRAGGAWWDACAGEGGKTLHLSDLMDGKGVIWASDRSIRRLDVLRRRAIRAGISNCRRAVWDGGPRPPARLKFDGVLVDAPCSGIGTWQRNPHARWSTGPGDVAELAAVQERLLRHAAASVKPGGRLVYAVCTLTRAETDARVGAFSREHPDFMPAPVFEAGESRQLSPGAPSVRLWPGDGFDGNGMFIAAWRRAGG